MKEILKELGIEEVNSGASYGPWIKKPTGGELLSINPTNGEVIAKVLQTGSEDYLENFSKQAQVKEYERQIDRMVYKLYDLTPEEIAIVEVEK